MATPDSKPRFWLIGTEVECEPPESWRQQFQQNLFERVASASAKVADLRANLETAEQQIAELHAEIEGNSGPPVVHTSSQHLRQAMQRKRRGIAIILTVVVFVLVALSLWNVETQREVARLRLDGRAADLLIAKLRDELVILRETILSESFGLAQERLNAALGSPNDGVKIAVSAEVGTMELRDENLQTKELIGETQRRTENEVTGLREDLPAQQAVATQPSFPGATVSSDQKVRGRTPEIKDVSDAPETEDILTTGELLSGSVISKPTTLDKVSPDDLLLAPGQYVGRKVMVIGSVMWLLRRYWLQSDSGQMRMLIDVKRLQSGERNKLKVVVAQIESLVQAQARIAGTIERYGTTDYRLAATKLVFVE